MAVKRHTTGSHVRAPRGAAEIRAVPACPDRGLPAVGLAAFERWLAAAEPEDVFFALGGAVLLALFPLARGGWDLWSQTLFELLLFGGAGLWCAVKLRRGLVLKFGSGLMPVLAVLAAAYVSCALSPVGVAGWRVFKWLAAGLAVFVFASFAGAAGRRAGTVFLLATGWFMLPLAVLQTVKNGVGAATGTYFNPNAMAGFLAMLVPLAFLNGYRVSAAVFVVAIVLAGARAAFAALVITGALYWAAKGSERAKYWALVTVAVLGAVWLAASFVLEAHRVTWWSSAWQMFLQRPLVGFGGGMFEYVFPAVHEISSGALGSLYAHSWPLELLAEYGLTGFLAMAWFAARGVWRAEPAYKWSAVAILLIALQDYVLSVPANFAVFCFLLASGEKAAAAAPPAPLSRGTKMVLAGTVLLVVFAVGARLPLEFMAEKQLLAAMAEYQAGRFEQAETAALKLCAQRPAYAAAHLLAARAQYARADRDHSVPNLLTAAVSYERALELNPYHILAYNELAGIYRMTGNSAAQAELAARRARFVTWRK